MRARPRLDPHLTRLTVVAVPPTVWQVVDRIRRSDLAPSLSEHLVPTLEAADTETGSRAALRASLQLPRGIDAPRPLQGSKGHLRGSAVSVECLST